MISSGSSMRFLEAKTIKEKFSPCTRETASFLFSHGLMVKKFVLHNLDIVRCFT